MVRLIDLASDINFAYYGQSFMQNSDNTLFLVESENNEEVQLMSYNLADNSITTICNFGQSCKMNLKLHKQEIKAINRKNG